MGTNKFVGVVTEIADNHNFIFRVNSDYKCQLQQVVGLNISNNTFVLANITNIEVGYFLKDKEEYFTSLSVDNKLQELSVGTRKPKIATKVKATYLGLYEYNENTNNFFESICSVDVYTPSIFQVVYTFNFKDIEAAYGLNQNSKDYFKLGTFLYPNYFNDGNLPDVNISTETFNSHTLISGVTGSGKSRLTALIANRLAGNGGHITIIDPHDEYMDFVDTKLTKVSFFSKNEQLHKERNDVAKRGISFANLFFTPQVVSKLLPELSDQQMNYIYEVFDKNAKDNVTIKTIIDSILEEFKSEFKAAGLNVKVKLKEINRENNKIIEKEIEKDKLTAVHEYAEKDTNDYISRYLFCLSKEVNTSKIGRLHVIHAVLKKLLVIYEANFFPISLTYPIPSWLNVDNKNSINIINLDYDSNTNIRRFVDTIIQCFFTPQTKNRTLIVDEAHLLLNEKSDTSNLLSRLLRESRKFGLSIIFITQNEEDVPEDIKSQFQNKFRFREEKDQTLKYLANQTCMCSVYKGKLSFPMRVDNLEKMG
ncbi:hypothetical protein FACS1894181_15380 [Bacteroidia bacterium]|nr:hypothetical protein FACS1894181_15380 [Bacteroidia bacterium]